MSYYTRYRGGGNDLMSGFEMGSSIADNLTRAMLQRQMMQQASKKNAIEEALLQIQHPGLQITQNTNVDGQDAIAALPVQPGTEDDNVQALDNGVLYNPAQAQRVKDNLAAQDRANRLGLLKDDLEMRQKYANNREAAPVLIQGADGRSQWITPTPGQILPPGSRPFGSTDMRARYTPHFDGDGNPYFTSDQSTDIIPGKLPDGYQSKRSGMTLQQQVSAAEAGVRSAEVLYKNDPSDENKARLIAAQDILHQTSVKAGFPVDEALQNARAKVAFQNAQDAYRADKTAYDQSTWYNTFPWNRPSLPVSPPTMNPSFSLTSPSQAYKAGAAQDIYTPTTQTPTVNHDTVNPSVKSQLDARLGIEKNATFADEIKAAASLSKDALKAVYDRTGRPIAEAIGADYANAFPDENEMEVTRQMHLRLQKAGVDVSAADDAYRRMNGKGEYYPNEPIPPNTERGYIKVVNALADKNSNSLVQAILANRNSSASAQVDPTMVSRGGSGLKQLTPQIAAGFLKQAGGNRARAQQLAAQAGYTE